MSPPFPSPAPLHPSRSAPRPRSLRARLARGPAAVVSGLLLVAPALAAAAAPTPWTAHHAPAVARDLPPELQTSEERSTGGMVSSGADPASRVGARILAEGGNAVDAAVATAFALGVVDPFNAGLGGESYILLHLSDGRDVAIDGSALVPLQTDPEALAKYLNADTRYGYPFVATPATPAALAYALERYGTMSLPRVLAPAIELAEFGHTLLPTVQTILDDYGVMIRENLFLSWTFLREGTARFQLGHRYCQPVLAATMRRLAALGMADFYRGGIADAIARDMAANGGYVSRLDLARVHPVERTPVRGRYRGLEVVAFPYPGGGDVVVRMLAILDAIPPDDVRCDDVDRLHLLIEAGHIAVMDAVATEPTVYASRPPAARADVEARAGLIRLDRALRDDEISTVAEVPLAGDETTHLSVVDRLGNAVSLTQSIGYGAFVATPSLGFEHNSMMEGADLRDRNSPLFPVPGRALRSTMAPTILLRDGKPFLVLGGAGSSRIPATIVSVVTGVVDRGLTLADAVAAPRAMFNPTDLYHATKMRRLMRPKVSYHHRHFLEIAGPITDAQGDELEARGFTDIYRLTFPAALGTLRSFGGVNAVMVDPETGELVGAGDPRRQGAAAGSPGR